MRWLSCSTLSTSVNMQSKRILQRHDQTGDLSVEAVVFSRHHTLHPPPTMLSLFSRQIFFRRAKYATIGAGATLGAISLLQLQSPTKPCRTEASEKCHDHEDDDEWKPYRGDFDIYLDQTSQADLIRLFRAHQSGLEVWPWIWTQPNESGPHHVFLGPVTETTLEQIRQVKRQIPNVNILVVTDQTSLDRLQGGEEALYPYECGLVVDTPVELTDLTNKLIMLQDERIINYTILYAS